MYNGVRISSPNAEVPIKSEKVQSGGLSQPSICTDRSNYAGEYSGSWCIQVLLLCSYCDRN